MEKKYSTEDIKIIAKSIYGSSGSSMRTGKNQKPDTLIKETERDLRTEKICTLGCFGLLDHKDRIYIHYKEEFKKVEYDVDFYKRIAKQLVKFQKNTSVICRIPMNQGIWLDDLLGGGITDVRKIAKNFKVRSIFKTQERQVTMPQRGKS
jgi:hypothetical protein